MSVEHFNVLIVGAGLSGVGAGFHLGSRCPDQSYAILEGRSELGGTWDLFRYPGVRSDSDMHTLGFSFRPWTQDRMIADGASILEYVRETAREYGIDRHIRFNRRVTNAAWSSVDARWTVDACTGDDDSGRSETYTCDFLYLCSGYYRYDGGYTPDFPGRDAFTGKIVHPQNWPQNLDYRDKRVVVIGSGATAVTLVPTLAKQAAHVTMLQRSPSYVVSLPGQDKIAGTLHKLLGQKIGRRAVRWKNILVSMAFYQLCQRRPETAKRLIRKGVAEQLGPDYPVDTHFKPSYNPWDQRLCLVPDADLFKAIRQDRAAVATGRIERFTTTGVRLASGRELDADLVVTATGLNLVPCGGVEFQVDGQTVDLGQTFSYKGLMLAGLPNLALCVGYTNASWTLRADLSSLFVCRLLNYMDRRGYVQCVPRTDDPADNPTMDAAPMLNLSSGYVQRSADILPKQGSKAPWKQNQNYLLDLMAFKFGKVNDKALVFSRRGEAQPESIRHSA